MALTYGYFNALKLEDGTYDRVYNADQMSQYFKGIVSNGVLANVSDGLKVIAAGGMDVSISAGRCFIESKWAELDAAETRQNEKSHATLSRYTAVVMRLSYINRDITIQVLDGTPAQTPTRPALTNNDSVKDICLGYIYVGKGVTEITQANIEDVRGDNNVCGFVTGLIDQVDTSSLFIQYQKAFEEDRETNQTNFNAWFDTVRDEFKSILPLATYETNYTTTRDGETEIPINIPQYKSAIDMIRVYINGLRLINGKEYTVIGDETVRLTKAVDVETPVSIEVSRVRCEEGESIVKAENVSTNAVPGVTTVEDAISKINTDSEAYKTLADDAREAVERVNEIVAGNVGIDDGNIGLGTTWSSKKINDNITTVDEKVNEIDKNLKAVAFSGSYSDLSNTPALGNAASQAVANDLTTMVSGSVLDARQGKVLNDKIDNMSVDYVIEEGRDSSGGLQYRKWSSGILEQWVSYSISTTVSTVWGVLYVSVSQIGRDYTIPFTISPNVVMALKGSESDGAWMMQYGDGSATKLPNFFIVRGATLTTTRSFAVQAYATGSWK